MTSINESSQVLSIVIPVYNEEKNIQDIIDRILAVEPYLFRVGISDLELIVVDDGSSDRTAEIVGKRENVKLIKHGSNKGYGVALKTGFCAAQGALLCFMDADGTYPPEYLPKLCTCALNGADIVIGSHSSANQSQMPQVRKISTLFWENLVILLRRLSASSPASGMRVFHRELLERLNPFPDELNISPVMRTRAGHDDIIMIKVPIH